MIKETPAQIQKRLIINLQATPKLYDPGNIDPDKRGLTSPSSVAVWRMFLNLIATEFAVFEDVLEMFEEDIEALIRAAPAGSNLWLQQKILEFQYKASSPQIIQLINFAPQYPVVNAALRIITQAAVVNDPNGGYIAKVAKGGATPTQLSTLEQDALVSYLNHINFGVPYTLVNAKSDKLKLGVDIFYDGQYSSQIEASVTLAINNWITTFNVNNFNGAVLLSKIEDIIQSVPGVIDVVLKQIEATPDPGAVVKMVDNSQELVPSYITQAGHIVIDDTAGRTLADTLNFIIS